MKKSLQLLVLLVSLSLFAVFSASAQNCTVNAGINTTICPGTPFTLTGVASGLINTPAVWTQVGGPSVTVSSTNVVGTAATATVTGYATDVAYTFRLSAKCTDGSLVYQDVVYTASSIQTANAGPDRYVCVGTTALQGSALNTGETGAWTLISGTGPTPATPSSPTSNLTFTTQSAIQTATYRWTVSKTTNGNTCTSFDDVVITNLGTAAVNAGSDINLSCYNVTTSTNLSGSNAPASATYGQSVLWTFVSGPSTPTISNTAIRNPSVSNLVQGTYVFRYTVTGPCVSGSDEVSVIVAAASQNITGQSNSTQTYCDGRTTVVLNGAKPLYAGETGAWTRVAGTGTVTDATAYNTTATGVSTGSQFRWTITNPSTGCTSQGTITITLISPPTISITGSNPIFLTCGANQATVSYTTANGTGTQYALISAPAGSVRQTTMGGLNNWTSAPNSGTALTGFDKIGTYVIRYRRNTDNGLGGCADAYADVTIVVSSAPTSANAGTKQVLACNVFNTNLAGNIPTTGTGKWSQVSGPSTATIADPLANNTAVSNMINGTYIFRWIISGGDGACTNTQSDVQVVVAAPTPTTSAAGNAQAVCNSTPVYLDGNTPVLNEVGTWTVVRTAGNAAAPEVTFSPNANSPKAVANGLLNSTSYKFTWTISNACGTSSSDVTIATSNTAGAKQATAGSDQCLTNGTTTFTLAGNQPTGGETGTWTRLSGPNTPTFTASTYNTSVTGATNGTYIFEWQLNRNACTATRDTVVVTISAAATTANANVDQNICGTSATLNGNNPTVGTGTWTQVGGAGGAIITDPLLRNTTVTGLTEGRYTFRWTISNNACSSNFDDMIVNVSIPPTTPNAGPDQAVCATTSTTLAGNTITSGTGYWTAVSGPTIPTFSNVNSPTATVSNLAYGVYTLRWTSRGGVFCTALTDDVVITVTQNANAGTDQSLCNVTTTNLRGNENSTGTWSNVSGPNTPTLTAAGTNGTVVTGMIPGTYKFNYHLNAVGACSATDDEVEVVIAAPPSASDAGADQATCLATGTNNFSFTMAATTPVSGTGTWTLLDKTTTVTNAPTITNANSATTTIVGTGANALPAGVNVAVFLYQWTVAGTAPCNGVNSNADIVRLTIYREPSAAVAGPNQTSACSNNVVMAATPVTVGLGTWSVVTQPGGSPTVNFDAINSPTTKITNLVTGDYTFRWTTANGNPTCAVKTSDVNVKVTTAPVTIAGASIDQTICNTNFPGTTSATLAGSTPDASETGTWSIVSQPTGSTASFVNANNPTTTINGLQAATGAASGTYTLRWTVKNTLNQTVTDCQSTDDMVITVYNTPSTAVAGSNQTICLGSPVTLAATAVAVDRGIGTWSVVSLPGGATAPVFSNVNSPTSTLNGLIAGTYKLRWTVSNGNCTATTADVDIVVENCEIGVAKSSSTPALQADGSYNVTLTFKVKNTGTTALTGVQVVDDLTLTFPTPKTWTVTSINASGTLSANTGFNGNANKNLLTAASSTLAVGVEETITLVLNVKLN